jgi:hypothetical protein
MSDEFYGFDDADFDDDQDYDGDEFDFDCGACYGPKGEPLGCQLAGTEECDWDCPYREQVERELRAQYAANCRWAKAKESKRVG